MGTFQPAQLYILDATSGAVLNWNYLGANNWVYGAATIANDRLYLGDGEGVVRAYRFPPTSGATAVSAEEASRVARAAGEARSTRLIPSPPYAGRSSQSAHPVTP